MKEDEDAIAKDIVSPGIATGVVVALSICYLGMETLRGNEMLGNVLILSGILTIAKLRKSWNFLLKNDQ